MKYYVECTMIYNGKMEVEANNAEEALRIAQENLSGEIADDFPDSGRFGKAEFDFGEATADYAEPME